MCLLLLVLLLRCAFTQRPTSGRSTTCDFASCCALRGTIVRTRLVLRDRRFRAWLRSSGFGRWRLPVHSESRYSLPALQKRALRRNPVFDFLRVLRLERAALCVCDKMYRSMALDSHLLLSQFFFQKLFERFLLTDPTDWLVIETL